MSKIRERREALGISISGLSHELRLNASVISWVELGKLAANPKVRKLLAEYYHEPEEILFSDSGLVR